jgi:hypothetical protein
VGARIRGLVVRIYLWPLIRHFAIIINFKKQENASFQDKI